MLVLVLLFCAQTTAQSVKVDLQPLVYHQFQVTAVNEYGASSFSLPSRFIFANPNRPGPPRDFKVTSMHVIKGHVEMDVSWKKPNNAIGKTFQSKQESIFQRMKSEVDYCNIDYTTHDNNIFFSHEQ